MYGRVKIAVLINCGFILNTNASYFGRVSRQPYATVCHVFRWFQLKVEGTVIQLFPQQSPPVRTLCVLG